MPRLAAAALALAVAAIASPVASAEPADGSGIVEVASRHSVAASLDRLEGILREKGLTVFARVEHSAEAAKVGLSMRPAALLLFGNPRAGTPIMVAAPRAALDLPLKVLAREDEKGQVWLSYNSPAWLQRRHGLKEEEVKPLAAVAALVRQAAAP